MRYAVVTLFPEFVAGVARHGVVGRAAEARLDPARVRESAGFRRGPAPDGRRPALRWRPGHGDEVRAVAKAIDAARRGAAGGGAGAVPVAAGQGVRPGGRARLCALPGLILLAGRYEGFDERLVRVAGRRGTVARRLRAVGRRDRRDGGDRRGDAAAAGGARRCGVGGAGLVHARAARPSALHAAGAYRGRDVPAVLLSGDHAAIARWRYKQALGRSFLRRPDLIGRMNLDSEQQALLDEFLQERAGD